jgi:AraC-like DNA-binding protein
MAESDVSLELDIECPIVARALHGLSQGLVSQVQVLEISAQLAKPTAAIAQLLPGSHALVFNPHGSLWLRTNAPPNKLLIPSGSLTFIRGGSRVAVLGGRGEQQIVIFTWHTSLSSALENWILTKAGSRHAPIRALASQSVGIKLKPGVDRFFDAIRNRPTNADPLLISALFELCGHLLGAPDQLRIARDAEKVPEPLTELIEAVRNDPTAPWPLVDAATRAGYSPFHFSRVFKAALGYGFHEYVERCRTEIALLLLIQTANPVDIVASSAGFGTPQSLRDAMKQYVGLVPSELRNLSDPAPRNTAPVPVTSARTL